MTATRYAIFDSVEPARISHADRFLRLLAIVLLGYALMGRSFAYIGVAPLYIGEATMMYGVLAMAFMADWSRILSTAMVWPILAFMAWGAARTFPYLSVYGADALRDGAIWFWGTFAIVIATLIASEPRRLVMLVDWFGVFTKIVLFVVPVTLFYGNFFAQKEPMAFWAPNVPYVALKGGDVVVHLTGTFAFIILMGFDLNLWWAVLGFTINLALNFTGRAAMVTFGLGAFLTALINPRSKLIIKLAGTLFTIFVIMWVTDLHIEGARPDNSRDISAEQIMKNVQSVFGDANDDAVDGSREWRLKWWNTIINYTFHGKYFWTGKGFGINLADEDGFQVNSDDSLRSPHNGHLCVLARAGVPGFVLWCTCHLALIGMLLVNAYQARRRGETRWFRLFMFLFIYFLAFHTNAAFDVYLESPCGGIWMWCVYGWGLGAVWVYRHHPDIFEQVEAERAAYPVDHWAWLRKVRAVVWG